MGKLSVSNAGRTGVFIFACFLNIHVFGQDVEKQDSITVKPMQIFQLVKPSCMPCHSEQGREKPRNAVNFSVWEQYNPTEKKMLASSIREELTKGNMPPKGYLKSHPEVVLTEIQMNQLVQWCDSLKTAP